MVQLASHLFLLVVGLSIYTCTTSLPSIPYVQPRLELGPLAAFLNTVDTGREAGTAWGVPRMVDTGPLLRLDTLHGQLSKRER
jgi:hypothetical protein